MRSSLLPVFKLNMSKIRSLSCLSILDKQLNELQPTEDILVSDHFKEAFNKLSSSTVIIVSESDFNLLPHYIKSGRKIYVVSSKLVNTRRVKVFSSRWRLLESIDRDLLTIKYLVLGEHVLGDSTLEYCSRIVRVIMGDTLSPENNESIITRDNLSDDYYNKFRNIKYDEFGNEIVIEKWSTIFKNTSKVSWYDSSGNFTYR